MRMTRPAGAGRRPHGFVLGFVVLMLFAISVAGATGYLIVSNEFAMARYSSQSSEALAVARAGLHRFVAEQIGVVGDSVSYAIGDGIAQITTRKLMAKDSVTDLYFLRSEATVSDIFTQSIPATRVVGAYAWHHRRPLAHHAALIVTTNSLTMDAGGTVIGVDQDGAGTCPGGGTAGITAGIARTSVTAVSGTLNGNPNFELWPGGSPDVYDSVALRWDVLSDPSFPVEFEDSPPNFALLPPDSFPIVRYNGSLLAGDSWDGRGVLIVTGQFDSDPGHNWRGIVLAGWLDDIMQGDVDGLAIGGLAGPSPYGSVSWRGDAEYHSCDVYAANETLSYLELVENTVFESN